MKRLLRLFERPQTARDWLLQCAVAALLMMIYAWFVPDRAAFIAVLWLSVCLSAGIAGLLRSSGPSRDD